MSSAIKTSTRVEIAAKFVDTYGDPLDTTSLLYLATGRPAAWGDEAAPDTAFDTEDAETGFWSTIIGVKQFDKTRIVPVVPRINWVSGTVFVTFDTADVNAYNTSFYVLNSESRVYKCTTAQVGASTDEPLEANEDGSGVVDNTGTDGYIWQYLYEIPQVNVDNLLNDQWMPVNYGTHIPAADAKDDENAIFTLGSKYVLVQLLLEDTDTDIGATGTSYRQTAIISNPLDNVAAPLTATTAGAAGLTANSGNLLHLENKFAITRAVGQSELQQTVLQF